MADGTESTQKQSIISREYKMWKKNAPYLYDMVISHSLEWPSLSVQFFPELTQHSKSGTITQKLLLSTHTSGLDKAYVHVMSIVVPKDIFSNENTYDVRLSMAQQIRVKDEANRARMSYRISNAIAVRSDEKEVYVFDYTKHLSGETVFRPELCLEGHEKGGYGLSWNYNNGHVLATSGDDGLVCVFDIVKGSVCRLEGHSSVVGDCCFSFFDEHVLYSCSDDRSVIVWDVRTKEYSRVENVHESDVHALHCSMTDRNVVCTGSKDRSVKVWDMRNACRETARLLSHKDDVLQVQFSPHFGNILVSASKDRRVCIWDTDRIGLLQSTEEEYPPELLFLHGGHTSTVCDVAFNPLEPWEIASVSEDNILQIWQISRKRKSAVNYQMC